MLKRMYGRVEWKNKILFPLFIINFLTIEDKKFFNNINTLIL